MGTREEGSEKERNTRPHGSVCSTRFIDAPRYPLASRVLSPRPGFGFTDPHMGSVDIKISVKINNYNFLI